MDDRASISKDDPDSNRGIDCAPEQLAEKHAFCTHAERRNENKAKHGPREKLAGRQCQEAARLLSDLKVQFGREGKYLAVCKQTGIQKERKERYRREQ